MTKEIAQYHFQGHGVRLILREGEPWFVASDVAKVLGYSIPTKAVREHCRSVEETRLSDSEGRLSKTLIIPERDLYRLIMRSKLPAAEQFEEWVVGEVLPAIRKTGGYQLTGERLIAAALVEAERVLADQRPAVEFYEAVTGSKDAIPMSQAAKVLDVGIGRNQLFEILRREKILRHNNEPYQQYVDRGWFRVVEQRYQTPDGETHVNIKPLVYQKGLSAIRRLLMEPAEKAKR